MKLCNLSNVTISELYCILSELLVKMCMIRFYCFTLETFNVTRHGVEEGFIYLLLKYRASMAYMHN